MAHQWLEAKRRQLGVHRQQLASDRQRGFWTFQNRKTAPQGAAWRCSLHKVQVRHSPCPQTGRPMAGGSPSAVWGLSRGLADLLRNRCNGTPSPIPHPPRRYSDRSASWSSRTT